MTINAHPQTFAAAISERDPSGTSYLANSTESSPLVSDCVCEYLKNETSLPWQRDLCIGRATLRGIWRSTLLRDPVRFSYD